MKLLVNGLVGFVALSHIGFLILEMVLWTHPIGQRLFGMTAEVAASSAVLAANQGLYNGFLAARLLWGLGAGRRDVTLFFLGCVVIAGLFGGLTVSRSVLFIDGSPRKPTTFGRGRNGASSFLKWVRWFSPLFMEATFLSTQSQAQPRKCLAPVLERLPRLPQVARLVVADGRLCPYFVRFHQEGRA